MIVTVIKFAVFAAIALISPRIIPGVKVRGAGSALLVALVFGIRGVGNWFSACGVLGCELGAEWHLAASRAGQDAAQPGEPR